MANHGLSKSRITAWRQCPKRLWLQIYRKDLLDESDEVKQLNRAGHEVGEVARTLCYDGILIDNERNLSADLADTQAALSTHPNRAIFEATFQHDGVLIQADVLLPTPKGYRMSEVKSSSSVKPYHVEDCAVQAWVLKHNKVKVAAIELVHIEKSFVYPGGGDYHGLLKYSRLDDEIAELIDQVPGWVAGARKTLAGNEPRIKVGKQCGNPFECPFKGYCNRDAVEQEYPLDILYRMSADKKDELRKRGIEDARKVPAEYLNDTQAMIQKVSKSRKTKFDLAAARQEIEALPYPRYYLDFETITFTVPRWTGTGPTTQVPFQWSCHIESASGKLDQEMFLDVSGNDPSRGCAESLVNVLGKEGPIFVYSSFERSRIAELAERFPDLTKKLHAINRRLVDLLPIARSHYYHPAMMGSWSIKAVLPTIAPDLRYDGMEVAGGMEAQLAYLEINDAGTKADRKQELIQGLRDYCTLDTLAMVRLAWFFEGRDKKGVRNAK